MTNSLVIFTKAALMLAEADTIQKAKELKSLALTAAEWAKRKNMGEDAIGHCRSYALEAERKMGEMLRQTERAKGELKRGPVVTARNHGETPTLESLGLTKRESTEAQKLAALPADRFDALKNGTTTKKQALNLAHVGHNSGENEWYTPMELVECARLVMGEIDCDPASSQIANRTVRAKVFFSKSEDGLKQKWNGRVFLNPPYAQPLVAQFAEAVAGKFKEGEISEAIVLVNNATETNWFGQIVGEASAICFPSGRVKFLDPGGFKTGAPLQGQACIYLGGKRERFCQKFSAFGFCCHVIRANIANRAGR
jgi:ParB family chromosome partitioning protein